MTFDWEIPLVVGGWTFGIIGGIILLVSVVSIAAYTDPHCDTGKLEPKHIALGFAVALLLIAGSITCAGFYSGTYNCGYDCNTTTTEEHNGPN